MTCKKKLRKRRARMKTLRNQPWMDGDRDLGEWLYISTQYNIGTKRDRKTKKEWKRNE